jgi:hypothetical protein
MTTTLIVPGLHDSGPDHWQSWLEARVANCARVVQDDWTVANLRRWAVHVREEILRAQEPAFIVAHSFGCLAAIQAATENRVRVTGALLVAPPDPDHWNIGAYLPHKPPGFPAIVVASADDPWMALEKSALWAERWGAEFIDIGNAGHVNSASGFGPWPEALRLLDRLKQASGSELQAAKDRASDGPGEEPHGSI